jgi:hypothetical protein
MQPIMKEHVPIIFHIARDFLIRRRNDLAVHSGSFKCIAAVGLYYKFAMSHKVLFLRADGRAVGFVAVVRALGTGVPYCCAQCEVGGGMGYLGRLSTRLCCSCRLVGCVIDIEVDNKVGKGTCSLR